MTTEIKTKVFEVKINNRWEKVRATSWKAINEYVNNEPKATDWRMVGMMSRIEMIEIQYLKVVK